MHLAPKSTVEAESNGSKYLDYYPYNGSKLIVRPDSLRFALGLCASSVPFYIRGVESVYGRLKQFLFIVN